jgi:hypothetical protein
MAMRLVLIENKAWGFGTVLISREANQYGGKKMKFQFGSL